MKKFQLDENEYIELNKLMKVVDVVSTGGEANIRIMNGEVKLNGATVSEKRKKIRVGDKIVYGKIIIVVEKKVKTDTPSEEAPKE
ncbi:MAG: RNA-binding S4 domain-containing protein [Chitinophagales bacterium]|jgi:ribosome-associated protein|nr:RNA-binding S4 domain-containing protein [Chitinophagales bacterium]